MINITITQCKWISRLGWTSAYTCSKPKIYPFSIRWVIYIQFIISVKNENEKTITISFRSENDAQMKSNNQNDLIVRIFIDRVFQVICILIETIPSCACIYGSWLLFVTAWKTRPKPTYSQYRHRLVKVCRLIYVVSKSTRTKCKIKDVIAIKRQKTQLQQTTGGE